MIWSAKQTVILFCCAIALVWLTVWLALPAGPASRLGPAPTRNSRRLPMLPEQEPPDWLTMLARAVLVLAFAALGLATLLDYGDSSH